MDTHKNGAQSALAVSHLSKTYKRGSRVTEALKDVSFAVEEGDFFGLLGPNGAGKSTLIGTLAGVVRPTSGSASVLGFNPKDHPKEFKMALGIVPQETTFDPHFTVEETLRLQSGYYGLRNNRAWLDEIVERLGLENKMGDRVMSLSGGMKRRVLIGQALVHRPPVIVLDEPTAGVDIELRHRLWDFMTELNRKGHTIILTTHYLEEAEKLCRNVALLNHGKLAALDTTETLLKEFSGERIRFQIASPLPEGFPIPVREGTDGFYSAEAENPSAVRGLLNALDSFGIKPERIELGKASLEEVFLKLTGGAK